MDKELPSSLVRNFNQECIKLSHYNGSPFNQLRDNATHAAIFLLNLPSAIIGKLFFGFDIIPAEGKTSLPVPKLIDLNSPEGKNAEPETAHAYNSLLNKYIDYVHMAFDTYKNRNEFAAKAKNNFIQSHGIAASIFNNKSLTLGIKKANDHFIKEAKSDGALLYKISIVEHAVRYGHTPRNGPAPEFGGYAMSLEHQKQYIDTINSIIDEKITNLAAVKMAALGYTLNN